MTVSPTFRNHAETMPKSENRNHAETAMKPLRIRAETAAETVERNRETIAIGEGAMVSPLLARGFLLRAGDPRPAFASLRSATPRRST
jgi:hypothetical protein